MTTLLMPRKKRDTIKSSYLMDSDLKVEIVKTAGEDDRNETQQLHYLVRLGLRYRAQMLKTPVDVPVDVSISSASEDQEDK